MSRLSFIVLLLAGLASASAQTYTGIYSWTGGTVAAPTGNGHVQAYTADINVYVDANQLTSGGEYKVIRTDVSAGTQATCLDIVILGSAGAHIINGPGTATHTYLVDAPVTSQGTSKEYVYKVSGPSGTFHNQGVTIADVTMVGQVVIVNPLPTAPGWTANVNVNMPGDAALQKVPEPITLTIKNPSGQAGAMVVKDPNGTVVVNLGAGAGKTATTTYTPDAGDVGAYSFYYAVFDAAHPNGQIASYGSQMLTATSADPVYSVLWSSSPTGSTAATETVTIPATGLSGSSGPPTQGVGAITNNTGTDQTIVWKDASGATVGASYTAPAGGAVGVDVSTLPGQASGTIGTYTAVDATTGQTLGTVTATNAGDGSGTKVTGNVTSTINAPAGAISPTSASSNAGNTPVGTTTSTGTPTTQVNNAATTVSGTNAGVTNQDIYNDVKTAIQDANNVSTPPFVVPGDLPPPDLSGYQTAVTKLQATADADLAQAQSTMIVPFNGVSVGSDVSSFHVPQIGILHAWDISYTGADTAITVFRALCLVGLNIMFWVATSKVSNESAN